MKKNIMKVILASFLVLSFSGCSHHEKVETRLVIDENFSGEQTIVVKVALNELSEGNDPYSVQNQIKDLINGIERDFATQFDAWVEDDKLWYSFNFSFSSEEDYEAKMSSITGKTVDIVVETEGNSLKSTTKFDGFVTNADSLMKWGRDLVDEANIISDTLVGYSNLELFTVTYKGKEYDVNSYRTLNVENTESASTTDVRTILGDDKITRNVSMVLNHTDDLAKSFTDGKLVEDLTKALTNELIVIDTLEVTEQEGSYLVDAAYHVVLTDNLTTDFTYLDQVTESAFFIKFNHYINKVYSDEGEDLGQYDLNIELVNYSNVDTGIISSTFELENGTYITEYNNTPCDELGDDVTVVEDKKLNLTDLVENEIHSYISNTHIRFQPDDRLMKTIMQVLLWGGILLVILLAAFFGYKYRDKLKQMINSSMKQVNDSSNPSSMVRSEFDNTSSVSDLLKTSMWGEHFKQKTTWIFVGAIAGLIFLAFILLNVFANNMINENIGPLFSGMLSGSGMFSGSGMLSGVGDTLSGITSKIVFSIITFNTFSYNLIFAKASLTLPIVIIYIFVYVLPNFVYIYLNKAKQNPTTIFNTLFIINTVVASIVLIVNLVMNLSFGIFGFMKMILFVNSVNVMLILICVGPINFYEKYNQIIDYALKKLRFTFLLGLVLTLFMFISSLLQGTGSIAFVLVANMFTMMVSLIHGSFLMVSPEGTNLLTGFMVFIIILMIILNNLYNIYDFNDIKKLETNVSPMIIAVVSSLAQTIVILGFILVSGINMNVSEAYAITIIPLGIVFVGYLIHIYLIKETEAAKLLYTYFSKFDFLKKK